MILLPQTFLVYKLLGVKQVLEVNTGKYLYDHRGKLF